MEIRLSPDRAISMLIVEDEENTLKILSNILSRKYPEVVFYTAINGEVGLELSTVHTPAIVVTDINMPVMGGVEMAVRIHATNPDTRFIAVTGISEMPIVTDSDGRKFEFGHLIVKPIDFGKLFAAIETCFEEIAPAPPN